MPDEVQPSGGAPEVELTYFGLQAYLGTTKHMGGLQSTIELIELCRVGEGDHVLDVGCGAGATAVYLAREHGCTVVGVDISERMVERSRERALREGLESNIEFRTADVLDLPFEETRFDRVLCESVITFVDDRQRAIREFARVTKAGGAVGLNEEIWLETPPGPEYLDYARRTWEIPTQIPTSDEYVQMLESAGLKDVLAQVHRVESLRESSQLSRYRARDMIAMFARTIGLYLRNPGFRRYMRARERLPKRLFHYLGYGLFAGNR